VTAIGGGILALAVGMIGWAVRIMRRDRTDRRPRPRAPARPSAGSSRTTPRRGGNWTAPRTRSSTRRRSAGRTGARRSCDFSTPVRADGEFHLAPETRFDRFFKRIGLATEIQTGDDEFHAECYVRVRHAGVRRRVPGRTRSSGWPSGTCSGPSGFRDVALAGRTVTATWTGFDPHRDDRPNSSRRRAARLLLLAREPAPSTSRSSTIVPAGTGGCGRVALWVFLIGFTATIFSIFAYPVISTLELLGRAAVVWVVGFPAFAYVSALCLRGTSTSHYVWGGLMAGAFFLPVPGRGVSGRSCCSTASSTPHRKSCTTCFIVEKYNDEGRRTRRTTHVRCQSWREGGGTESFDVFVAGVRRGDAAQVPPGSDDPGRVARGRVARLQAGRCPAAVSGGRQECLPHRAAGRNACPTEEGCGWGRQECLPPLTASR